MDLRVYRIGQVVSMHRLRQGRGRQHDASSSLTTHLRMAVRMSCIVNERFQLASGAILPKSTWRA